MSLLSRKNTAQPKTAVTASDIFFNFSPQTHPGTMPTAQKLKQQTEVIQNMKSSNLDIFKSNPAVKSVQKGHDGQEYDVYHTSQIYTAGAKHSSSVEELAHALNEHDLCLAVSAISPSANTTTLSMMDGKTLSNALRENQTSVSLPAGDKGHMVVSWKKQEGLNWISSVDFHWYNK